MPLVADLLGFRQARRHQALQPFPSGLSTSERRTERDASVLHFIEQGCFQHRVLVPKIMDDCSSADPGRFCHVTHRDALIAKCHDTRSYCSQDLSATRSLMYFYAWVHEKSPSVSNFPFLWYHNAFRFYKTNIRFINSRERLL